jgi:hypothetical protein
LSERSMGSSRRRTRSRRQLARAHRAWSTAGRGSGANRRTNDSLRSRRRRRDASMVVGPANLASDANFSSCGILLLDLRRPRSAPYYVDQRPTCSSIIEMMSALSASSWQLARASRDGSPRSEEEGVHRAMRGNVSPGSTRVSSHTWQLARAASRG